MSATIDRWVRIRSWHRISHATPGTIDAVTTRCGRSAVVVGTLPGGPFEVHATAEDLPLGDRSCESCLRLAAHDAENAA